MSEVKENPVSYAIIAAFNPYNPSRLPEYAWLRNDGTTDELHDPKTFRKIAKRSADRLAERTFREHCGGNVVKIHTNKEKFIEHYLKLTGNKPAIN